MLPVVGVGPPALDPLAGLPPGRRLSKPDSHRAWLACRALLGHTLGWDTAKREPSPPLSPGRSSRLLYGRRTGNGPRGASALFQRCARSAIQAHIHLPGHHSGRCVVKGVTTPSTKTSYANVDLWFWSCPVEHYISFAPFLHPILTRTSFVICSFNLNLYIYTHYILSFLKPTAAMVVEKVVPLMVTSILFTTLAVVIVISRLFTRLVLIKNAGADDYLIAVAAVSFLQVI